MSDHGPDWGPQFRAGEAVFSDDHGTRPADFEASRAFGVRSGSAVPLLRDGRLAAILSTAHPEPRRWTDAEKGLQRDVTERLWLAVERARAEAALRASEERNRLIVEGARDYAILTADRDGRVETWSPGAEAAFGWTAAEMAGRPLDRTFTPEDRAAGVPAAELATAAAHEIAPDVRWHVRKDGGRVFIEGTVRALRDHAGALRGFLKVGQDVTARRDLDEALREGETRFRALVENVQDYAIFLLDADALVTAWPPGAQRVKGYAPDEVLGRPLEMFYTPEDVAAGVPARELAEAVATGRAEREGWRVRKNGERFWVNEIATAIHDAGGRLTGFTKISRDLTERRRAEEAVRASEERFRAVANLVPDLLWRSSPDATMKWCNARWTAYTGEAPAEAVGRSWQWPVHPDDRDASWAEWQAAVAAGRPFRREQRMRAADGTYRWFLAQAEPLRDEAGAAQADWFGSATDVHDERVALAEVEERVADRTAELARANARLRDENEARARAQAERNELLRNLASAQEAERRRLARELHDEAGQHLTAIGLGLRALTDAVPPGSEADARADALRGMVDTLGRELHALAVQLRPRALDDFGLETALGVYGEAWSRQSGIPLDVHARVGAGRLPAEVESAIYRIVQEALTNVARHSGATRAAVLVDRPDGHVRVVVEDDGRGFDSSREETGEAGGLGLLGVRERATLLGGSVEVESSPGAGTTLYVRIPVPNAPGPAAGG